MAAGSKICRLETDKAGDFAVTIEVREMPSADDCGDWYVIINGIKEPRGFWSEAAAEAAVTDFLWRGMVLG
jgi:hypothetical protein